MYLGYNLVQYVKHLDEDTEEKLSVEDKFAELAGLAIQAFATISLFIGLGSQRGGYLLPFIAFSVRSFLFFVFVWCIECWL